MKKTNNRPVVHETPEVGQPGPSADEYVAMITFAVKLVVLQLLFTKKLKKIPQQCHKEPMHID
jgi:hypothetical protein